MSIILYGEASNGFGTLKMWVATARSFVPGGVNISARTYSTNTCSIASISKGYEFTFSGLALPSDSVLVFGLDIINAGSNYDDVFAQLGVNTGSYPLYVDDVATVFEYCPYVNNCYTVSTFQPRCTIYGIAPATFSVTYNGNGNTGGTAPVDSNSPYLSTSTVTVLGQGSLTKTNKTFVGWSTNSSATSAQYISGSTFTITGNVVLYAVWVDPYTVTYDANSNSASGYAPVDPNSPYQHGATVTVLGQGSLYLAGHNFAGWDTDPSATNPTYLSGSTFTITGNVVLYAVWYSIPPVSKYPVTYNGNGNTGGSPPVDNNLYASNASVTVLGQNTLTKTYHMFIGWAKSSSASSPTYVPGNVFNMPSQAVSLYAVWSFSGGSTIDVAYNGRYAGAGSKQDTRSYDGVSPIMKVQSNLPNNIMYNAVVENLVIDGLSLSNGATGILLENVYNCLIRNVTIMNCEVGIRVKLTAGNWSHGNRFEHIRMINVKTGILFEGVDSARDFSYTTIDGVGISLAGNSTDVGIKIGAGNAYANLYSCFIKATVWLAQSGGKGLEVNGQLKTSLVNLEVEQDGPSYNGRGVVINSGASVSSNQDFLLTALGFDPNNFGTRVVNNSGNSYDIAVFPPL